MFFIIKTGHGVIVDFANRGDYYRQSTPNRSIKMYPLLNTVNY
jgi:hypothetical protein